MSKSEPENRPAITRRALLRQAGIGLAALPLAGVAAEAVTKSDAKVKFAKSTAPVTAATELAPLNRFPRMMHDYFLARITAQERATEAKRAQLRTRADAEAFIRERADKVKQCFGPLPPKTPLNPRTTGRIERDTYMIENVIFESRPAFLVTENFYLPKAAPSSPRPGVVGVCGHSDNGKAAGTYQSFAQGLARLGYVCFLIDPTGQGE